MRQNQVYEVQEIIDEAIIDNQPHYLIKWKGFTHDHDTWQPLSALINIIQYLKHWLLKNRIIKDTQVKNSSNFKNIKNFMDRENLSKKTKIREKYCQKILNKKKIWQKYYKEDSFINNQPQQTEQENNQINEKDKNKRCLDSPEKQQDILKDEQKAMKNKISSKQQQNKDKFNVIGSINTDKIKNIVSRFVWQGTNCVQVQLQDNKCFYMLWQDLKSQRPDLAC